MSVLVYSAFTQVCVAWVALQLYLPLWKSGDCTKGCFFLMGSWSFFGFSTNFLSTSGKYCSALVELNSIQWFDRLFSLKCCQYTERVAAEHCRCLYLTFMWFTLICHYFCEAPCEAPAYITYNSTESNSPQTLIFILNFHVFIQELGEVIWKVLFVSNVFVSSLQNEHVVSLLWSCSSPRGLWFAECVNTIAIYSSL